MDSDTQPGKILDQLEGMMSGIMQIDAAWCRPRIRTARQKIKQGKPLNKLLQSLIDRCTHSVEQVQRRKQRLPQPKYDEALPIVSHKDEIIAAIRKHQVLVIAGETGSGKTTQIPKMCLEAERGVRGLIGCTQPRRIAAHAMADRVAEELNNPLGDLVGYQVRFREQLNKDGLVKFMTDGILLAETTHDHNLNAYDTIIIDEAHERSLNIDFLLGYLKQLLRKRPDLRVIITSATIDTAKFAKHFNNAPVIEVSGRGYPVEVEYLPFDEDDSSEQTSGKDLYAGIAKAIHRLNKIDARGDTLVFLSGEREIHEARDYLQRQNFRHTEVLPLFARLPVADQRKVFHPGGARRIILSTNVAETSLTVPRIQFVIDSGLVRISRYSHRSRVQRLPIEAVSQASANQRKGRCGRLGPGTCIRLYSQDDFESRPEFTEPEILRTSLASVILRMLTTRLGAVEDFPFLDAPAPRMINDAYHLLFELGAIDEARRPTASGQQLSRWPLDVRLGRMIMEGNQNHCINEVLVLAAGLSIQDPRERPMDVSAAADEKHSRFEDEKSDFVALLKLWDYLKKERKQRSANQFRKMCRQEFLNWQRVNEWFDLKRQLLQQAREEKLSFNHKPASYEQIHQSLLSGLLSHVGHKDPEDTSYIGTRSRTFHVFPGSGLFNKRPQWIMASEIVETSKTWARTNAVIEPEWIEKQAQHLLKQHYYDPHWSRKQGRVLAWEQVSLFGLVLFEKRRVNYSRIDPVEARKIFITGALVQGELAHGDLGGFAGFLQNNQQVREEIEELEHKRRKHDVMADESALFEFFDARIPEDVCDSVSFESWLKALGKSGRQQLYISHDVLLQDEAGAAPQTLYPDSLAVGVMEIPLVYQFNPGDEADGVTLSIPIERLNTLNQGQLQWLVPGLLRDKVIALIKLLPKPKRRVLTPVPQFADAALERLQSEYPKPLLPALANALHQISGLEFEAADFDESMLEQHLCFRIQLTDDSGKILVNSRSLEHLQEKYGQKAKRKFMDQLGKDSQRDQESDWVFGELPRSELSEDGTGQSIKSWPAVVDQQDAVGLRSYDTAEEASTEHYYGVLRLLSIQLQSKIRDLRKSYGLSAASKLAWSTLGSTEMLAEQLVDSSLALVVGAAPTKVRSQSAFEQLLTTTRAELGPATRRQAKFLDKTLQLWSGISAILNDEYAHLRPAVYEDMRGQLDDMIYDGFLQDLDPTRLRHYPRYLQAMQIRLQGIDKDPHRDADRMGQVSPYWEQYVQLLQDGHEYDENVDVYRWLIEEFRVSLFAQQLGTASKVSVQRLRQAWKKID
jgi:ATP-dependent helicase HrpA